MPAFIAALTIRWAVTSAAVRRDALRIAVVALLHLAALGVMVWSEYAPEQKLAFLLTWGFLNFFWLALTRRPAVSAALSLAMIALLVLLWRFDALRLPRVAAVVGAAACLAGLVGVSVAVPTEPHETFFGNNHVSYFARSGVGALSELWSRGFMESDAVVADRLRLVPETACNPLGKPPHIIMVH